MLEKGTLVKIIGKGLYGYGKVGVIFRILSPNGKKSIRYILRFSNGECFRSTYYENELCILQNELIEFPINNSYDFYCNWCRTKLKSYWFKNVALYSHIKYCPKCLR